LLKAERAAAEAERREREQQVERFQAEHAGELLAEVMPAMEEAEDGVREAAALLRCASGAPRRAHAGLEMARMPSPTASAAAKPPEGADADGPPPPHRHAAAREMYDAGVDASRRRWCA
jgi:hypothetical protein